MSEQKQGPSSASFLDGFLNMHVGVFWLCETDTLRGSPDNFDPERPSILYAHGWQPGAMAKGKLPSLQLDDGYDGALDLLSQGCNVGILRWAPFSDTKIVGFAGDKVFATKYMAWRDEKGNKRDLAKDSRYRDKTVAQMLCATLVPFLGHRKEWTVTGQSLGGSVALRVASFLVSHDEAVHSVVLHDGYYFRKKLCFTAYDSSTLTAEMAEALLQAGIPVVSIRHTGMVESIGVVNTRLKECSAYVRVLPNHLSSAGAKHQHAFSWWTRTASTRVGDVDKLPQFHTPREVLLGMCKDERWYQHVGGCDTNDVSKHIFEVRPPPAY